MAVQSFLIHGNWVTCASLSVDMHLVDGAHQPPKAGSRPPLWIPLTFPSTHLQGVTESSLVLGLSSFPPGPLKNPRYPCNFRCNVYLAVGVDGGVGGHKKGPHSQTARAAFKSKHVQEVYVRLTVNKTEAHVFWS